MESYFEIVDKTEPMLEFFGVPVKFGDAVDAVTEALPGYVDLIDDTEKSLLAVAGRLDTVNALLDDGSLIDDDVLIHVPMKDVALLDEER